MVSHSRPSSILQLGGSAITPTSPDHDFLRARLRITNGTRAAAALEFTVAASALGTPLKGVARIFSRFEHNIDATGIVNRMQLGPGRTTDSEFVTFEIPKSVETKDVIVTFDLSWWSNRVVELPLQ